jgi:TIR domain
MFRLHGLHSSGGGRPSCAEARTSWDFCLRAGRVYPQKTPPKRSLDGPPACAFELISSTVERILPTPLAPVKGVNFFKLLLVMATLDASRDMSPARLRERRLGAIFISYRRSDSQGEAGRLFDDLVKHFGEHTVFMDVAGIEAGRDFRKAIEESVAQCGVLLVVMGPGWLNANDERGGLRLNDPTDFVRIETAAALRRDIPVIPILVRGAEMPRAEQLPEDLKDLAYRNCIELTHARWRSDIQLLIEALRRVVGDTSQSGAKTRPDDTTASHRPGTPQELTGTSRLETPIDPAAVERVSRELALYIGPVASVVVRRGASGCSSVEGLYLKVAEEIDSREEREKFLLKRAPIPSTPRSDVAPAAPPANDRSSEPGSPPPSEGHDVRLPQATPPTGMPRSSRWKYVLLVSAGGIVLILVLAIRLVRPKGAGSSQTVQTSPQESHSAESAPVTTGAPPPPAEASTKTDEPAKAPAARAAGESKPKPPQRVRVSPEVSMGLLISRVSPVYPPLARQARMPVSVTLRCSSTLSSCCDCWAISTGFRQ